MSKSRANKAQTDPEIGLYRYQPEDVRKLARRARAERRLAKRAEYKRNLLH